MANNTSNDWDITYPQDSNNASQGAKEIRVMRESVQTRIGAEHTTPAASGVGGVHQEGSARITVATSAPSSSMQAREGAVFSNSSNNYLYVHDGSSYTEIGYSRSGHSHTGVVLFKSGTTQSITEAATEAFNIVATGSSNTNVVTITSSTVATPLAVRTTGSSIGINVYTQGGGTALQVQALGAGADGEACQILVDATSTARALTLHNYNDMPHISFYGDTNVAAHGDGDMWFEGTNLKMRVGAATKTFTWT